MYLGNPLLPINTTAAQAGDSIKKELEKKNWHEFELAPLRLDLVPYFLFNYHYYIENEGDGKRTVKSTIHGVLAIDGHDIAVREDLTELIKLNWKHSAQEIPKGKFFEKWCNIDKREQDEVLKIKAAKHFDIPKENIVVSSARKLYLPLYRTKATIGGKGYELTVIAVDGRIEGIKEVPVREKGYAELARETVNELKDPKNWINYSKDAILAGASTASKRGKNSSSKNSKKHASFSLDSNAILIILIIIALILIIIGLFRVKPF